MTRVLASTPHFGRGKLAREESAFEGILAAIAQDKPLAQPVIDISNSAWFGGRVKSDTMAIAFGRLGVADFYNVVVAAALRYHVGDSDQPEFKRWWTSLNHHQVHLRVQAGEHEGALDAGI